MAKPLMVGFSLAALGLTVTLSGHIGRSPLAPIREAELSQAPPTTSAVLVATNNESGRAAAAGVPDGYVKVFADEFNEPRLDTSKWWTRYIYNDGMLDVLNDEQQRYREADNHVMTGHSLVLTARKNGAGSDGYLSGMIRSKTTFKYGYFEARMKVPGGVGVRPAFWLNSARRSSDGKIAWPPEIDIAEIANNGVEDTTRMLHVGLISNGAQGGAGLYVDPEFHADGSYWSVPWNLADDFHVFAALWEAGDIVSVFVDSRLIYKAAYRWVYDDGSPAGYAHVLLDLAIGGPKWAGRHGVDDAAFPQGLEIDYIRVYQKSGQRLTGMDGVGKDLCPPQRAC